jgi:hypothetical protein
MSEFKIDRSVKGEAIQGGTPVSMVGFTLIGASMVAPDGCIIRIKRTSDNAVLSLQLPMSSLARLQKCIEQINREWPGIMSPDSQ